MRVFQLIKRVGGFCHLHTTNSGIGNYRRVPIRYLPTFTHPILPDRPSLLPRRALMTAVATTSQAAHPFQDIDTSNSADDSSQKSLSCAEEAREIASVNQSMIDGYRNIMKEVFNKFPKDRPGKNVSPEQFLQVQEILLSDKMYNDSPLDIVREESDSGLGPGPGPNSSFRQVMNGRRDQFLESTNFTMGQFQLAGYCLVQMGSLCAKQKNVNPMMMAWSKIKDMGIILKPNFVSTFLYVLGLEEKYLDTTLEIARFHDLLYGPTENSVYLQIKALVAMDDLVGAEKVLGNIGVSCHVLNSIARSLQSPSWHLVTKLTIALTILGTIGG